MLLYLDSFDHYVTADVLEKWTTGAAGGTGSTITIQPTSGRRGSGGWRWVTGTLPSSAVGGFLRRTVTPADATAILGFAFRASGVPGAAGYGIAWIDHSGSPQVTVRLNQDLTISVVRGGPAGTTLGTTSAVLTVDTYAYLELKVMIANTGGTVTLRVNGATVLGPVTGDTQATGSAVWTGAAIGHPSGVSNATTTTSRNVDFDDVYVGDGSGAAPWNTFLGDCRVDARVPTAPGATTGWTPSAGANWQCVDEAAPNDDTDYTTAAAVSLTDTFAAAAAAPVAGATIYGVQHCLSVRKTDAGVCTIAPVIRHSGTDYPGAAISPGTAYAYGLQIAATNPGTAAAWTESDFNAAEFGYSRIT